jgi:cellulose synthase/poly-beta-1,6-N-acetylglucosamine synthase-like glycosyltransferase
MMHFAEVSKLFTIIEKWFIFYVSVDNGLQFMLLAIGFFTLNGKRGRLSLPEIETLMKSPLLPGVSILSPAHNEELTICDSVRSMLRLRHPSHEVIVINDGSTDQTLKLLIDEFRLYRSSRIATGSLPTATVHAVYESLDTVKLVVIDKENGGKADALNAGLNYARMPLVGAVDSDSLLERDALIGVSTPFLEDPDTVATGGIVRVINGCTVKHGLVQQIAAPKSLWARLQVVEYLRAFLGGRVALSAMNSLMLISGAFGLFKRQAIIDAGGFWTSTVGEDMELVIRLHRRKGPNGRRPRIVFVPEPVCWTQVPDSMKVLRRQRNRWQRGATESIFRHRDLVGKLRWGTLGMFGLPYFVIFELFAPIVELAGYAFTIFGLIFKLIEPFIALEFFIVSVLFSLFLSLSAIVLEELTTRRYPSVKDLCSLLLAALIECLFYRQMTAIWRTKGMIDFVLRKKGWGKMDRQSFQEVPEAKAAA